MTNLTNFAVLSAALAILSTSCVVPSALAQGADSSKPAAASDKAATPSKRRKRKLSAKQRAKLKSAASKDIEKGVEQAGKNVSK